MIHDFTQPDKPDVPIQNPLVKLLASGQTHTYGITDSGEISTISADGSSHTVAKINPNKVSTEFFSVDPSNDNTLYGIFFDRELGKNAFYQMNISDSFHFSRSKSPEPDEIQTSFAGQMFQIVPSDFQIFLGVYDPSQYKFSILALDKMTFQFKSWPVIPNLFSKKRPVIAYDTQNKTIFFTTSDESTFTLHAVDTNNGAYQKVYVSSSALSDPFLTKPLNKEQTKIVTLDGAGILRAFQRDSSKEYLAINQYIFNNGKNSLELFPQQSNYTFYPTLTTQSGNFLKTVLSSDLGQNIFPINLNW